MSSRSECSHGLLEEYRVTTPDSSKRSRDKKVRKSRSQLGKDRWFRRKLNAVKAAESRGVHWVAERVGRSARTIYRWIHASGKAVWKACRA
jgi:hypothetical protein